MRCVSFPLLLIVAGLSLGACVGAEADLQAFDDHPAAAQDNLPLKPGDKLRVHVFGEEKLTGEYQIDRSGKIEIPLVGSVTAAGATAKALERNITAKLAALYMRNPSVMVEMASPMPFYILGEVEKPGRYDYDGGLNVWRAIAMAGGQTYRASTDTIYVQHAGDPHWHELALSPSILVDPGDLIRVPDRWF